MKTTMTRGNVLTNEHGQFLALGTLSMRHSDLHFEEHENFRKLLPGEQPPYKELEDDDPGCCCIPWIIWFILGLVIGMSCR